MNIPLPYLGTSEFSTNTVAMSCEVPTALCALHLKAPVSCRYCESLISKVWL